METLINPLSKASRLSATILLRLTKKKSKKNKEGYIIGGQEKKHLITATVVDWVDYVIMSNQIRVNYQFY